MCELSTVPPAVAATCCARAALWRTSSERRPRSAVLTTLRPKSPREAGSSVMPAAPPEDCARSGPDLAGASTPAVSRPTDTAPSFDFTDFVSLPLHAARARTSSTLAPRDFATIAERNASMPSTSLGRVPRAEHLPAPKGPSTAQPTPCTLPAPDRFPDSQHAQASPPLVSALIRRCGSPDPFARPPRAAAPSLLAPRAGHGRGGGVRQRPSIPDVRPRSPSLAPA